MNTASAEPALGRRRRLGALWSLVVGPPAQNKVGTRWLGKEVAQSARLLFGYCCVQSPHAGTQSVSAIDS
jgi:hypothetical protein